MVVGACAESLLIALALDGGDFLGDWTPELQKPPTQQTVKGSQNMRLVAFAAKDFGQEKRALPMWNLHVNLVLALTTETGQLKLSIP